MEIIALFDDFTVQHVSKDENTVFWKNGMVRFTKLDVPVFSQCAVRQSIMVNQVQQNRIVRFLKLEGLKFSGL
jgi:hypothetical protein